MRQPITYWMVFTFTCMIFVLPTESSAGWIFNRNNGNCDQECYISNLPPGTRQKCEHGKLWPPQPRPTVPKQSFWQQFHTTKYWPYPYKAQDKALILDAFEVQRANGWKTMTTLYEFHFDQETNALNSAGQYQLEWILQNAPAQYRSAYVQTSRNQSVSDARLSAVQTEVINQTGHMEGLPVMLRVAKSLGRPAAEVQVINDYRRSNVLAPTILYQPGASLSGGSGE